ncbi:MAG: shikimate kinase [Bacteroidia bacterium]
MPSKDLVFIWGMPGSGKTTLGKKLAKELNFDWIDSDNYIENAEGKSVSELFEKHGEEYFRKLEKKSLEEFLNLNKVLISCGGGFPVFNQNNKTMLENGFCIYLKAELGLLNKRLIENNSKRPLLSGSNEGQILKKLTEIFGNRKEIFETAHYQINIPVKSSKTFIIQASQAFYSFKNETNN